jgi:hypothetical protein
VWARGSFMWNSSCFGCFLEMRSALFEVRALREDLNARWRKGEQPEKKYFESALCRCNDAIAALAECLVSQKSAVAGRGAGSPLSDSNHGGELWNRTR